MITISHIDSGTVGLHLAYMPLTHRLGKWQPPTYSAHISLVFCYKVVDSLQSLYFEHVLVLFLHILKAKSRIHLSKKKQHLQ